MPRPRARCGTESAYRRHLRHGEPVDDACRRAHNENNRLRRNPTATPQPVDQVEVLTAEEPAALAAGDDELAHVIRVLREVFDKLAESDPGRLAPIARLYLTALDAAKEPVEVPKELSLAEQLAEARAARVARTAG